MKKSVFVWLFLAIAVAVASLLDAFPGREKHVIVIPSIVQEAMKIRSKQQATASITSLQREVKKTKEKGCVFRTVFNEENSDSNFIYKSSARVLSSQKEGLAWLVSAQENDGGWGAGTHVRQDIMNPHAVPSDPATTAIVSMALLRCGNTLSRGDQSRQLRDALYYLLTTVEETPVNSQNITKLSGTQPQIKLGQNIDVVLTSQFLTNMLDKISKNDPAYSRIKKANEKCIGMIQNGQESNGSMKGAGWAGVLQSSFATNALESAKAKGLNVDESALERSRDYQISNVSPEGKSISTEDAAGVILYSVSGAARSSAHEAREARIAIETAIKEGTLKKGAAVSVENLRKAGIPPAKAMRYGTAYEVNKISGQMARQDDVMNGFGSNGGEEFLSYLQTGEGLIISHDVAWKQWYDNITGRLIQIQNDNGSWNGHHCITSPVFCTATSLLILSVNNDIEELMTMDSKSGIANQ